jgi:hypothetical protein
LPKGPYAGPRTESDIATREMILEWLSEAARRGNVPVMRLLLEELRHDVDQAANPSVIDELASKRKKAATIVD